MKDLLLNTGRAGFEKDNRRFRINNCDPDMLPRRISRRLLRFRRSQGDRLNPLYRFLEKNCGRPWADVYSEICRVSDHRTIRGYHLREHVEQYVQPTEHGRRGSYGPFFVSGGILYKERRLTNEERRKKYEIWLKTEMGQRYLEKNPPPPPTVKDTEGHYWSKIDGYWYEFTVTHIKINYKEEFLIDLGNNEVGIGTNIHESFRNRITKRQVDSKMSKQLEAEFHEKTTAHRKSR